MVFSCIGREQAARAEPAEVLRIDLEKSRAEISFCSVRQYGHHMVTPIIHMKSRKDVGAR